MVARLLSRYKYGQNSSQEFPDKGKSFSEAFPVFILEAFRHLMRRTAHPTKEVFRRIGVRKGHPQLVVWFGMFALMCPKWKDDLFKRQSM